MAMVAEVMAMGKEIMAMAKEIMAMAMLPPETALNGAAYPD